MKTSTLPPESPPNAGAPVPVPLWERHLVFREPVYAEGVEPLEDEGEADGGW
jgi:hypothetical protein